VRNLQDIDWAEALARLHPVLLHLPIGLIVALCWLEFWGWFKKGEDRRRGQGALVWLLVLSTPLAAASGWLLHEGGGYGEKVEWHEWGGISLAFLSLAAGWSFWRRSRLYPWLVWLGFVLLVPTAHLGAGLTHGEDFLLEPWLEPAEDEGTASNVQGDPAQLVVDGQDSELNAPPPLGFADVLPILEARCTRCHGEKKQRGDLALHTEAGALAGGEYEGPSVVFGDPDASPLITRIRLPLDHEDHMPPENKPQPTALEVAWLEAWIRGEPAPGEAPVFEEEESAPASSTPEEGEETSQGVSAPDPEAVAAAVAALRERRAHAQARSAQDASLWIDLSASAVEPAERRGLLEPLSTVIAELGLARSALVAGDLELCAAMPRLERLDLRRLELAEGEALDLGPLAGAPALRVLNLAGTPVGGDPVRALAALPALERVYLWGTGLEESLAELTAALPAVELVGGSAAPDLALETEPEVAFGEPGSLPAGPENSACPISGQPVDAGYTVLYEGRAIGFCCPNCPKTFWEDPQAGLAVLDGE